MDKPRLSRVLPFGETLVFHFDGWVKELDLTGANPNMGECRDLADFINSVIDDAYQAGHDQAVEDAEDDHE